MLRVSVVESTLVALVLIMVGGMSVNVTVTVTAFVGIKKLHGLAVLPDGQPEIITVEPALGAAVMEIGVPLRYGPVEGLTAMDPVPVPAVVTVRA